MKKIVLFMLLMGAVAWTAQAGVVRFKSDDYTRFIIYLNGKRMNWRPTETLRLENIRPGTHRVYIKTYKRGRVRDQWRRIRVRKGHRTVFNVSRYRGQIDIRKVREVPLYNRHWDGHGNRDYPVYDDRRDRNDDRWDDGYDRDGRRNDGRRGDGRRGGRNPGTRGVSDRGFEDFYSDYRKQSHDSYRMLRAQEYIRQNRLRSREIAAMVGELQWEYNKVKLALFALGYCTDPTNYHTVYHHFDHRSSRDQVETKRRRMRPHSLIQSSVD